MTLTIADKREYTPKWNDNASLPPSEQITVKHKNASIAIKEKIYPKKFELDSKGEITGFIEMDRFKLINAFEPTFWNCGYQYDSDNGKDSKKVTIKTATDLFAAPAQFDGLIQELYDYFGSLLNTQVDVKN